MAFIFAVDVSYALLWYKSYKLLIFMHLIIFF